MNDKPFQDIEEVSVEFGEALFKFVLLLSEPLFKEILFCLEHLLINFIGDMSVLLAQDVKEKLGIGVDLDGLELNCKGFILKVLFQIVGTRGNFQEANDFAQKRESHGTVIEPFRSERVHISVGGGHLQPGVGHSVAVDQLLLLLKLLLFLCSLQLDIVDKTGSEIGKKHHLALCQIRQLLHHLHKVPLLHSNPVTVTYYQVSRSKFMHLSIHIPPHQKSYQV